MNANTSSKKALLLFPGQGSQKVGMGLELTKESPIARELFEKADKVLGFSLSKICFEGPADSLNLTANTQPAILTMSVACFEVFKAARGGAFKPVAAAGHSLGEYSALVAAGALKFEDAVRLVNRRGTYMQEAVPAGEGRMIAVLGKEAAEIETAIKAVTSGVVQIANINAPGQIVVAGAKNAVAALTAAMPGTKVVELSVSAPFHCPLMKPAEERLAVDLANTEIRDAQFPVYANYYGRPLIRAADIREALKLQVCGQVRWIDCMQNAIAEQSPEIAIEFGTGSVLSGMLKRINGAVPRSNIDSLASLEKLT